MWWFLEEEKWVNKNNRNENNECCLLRWLMMIILLSINQLWCKDGFIDYPLFTTETAELIPAEYKLVILLYWFKPDA